MIDIFMILGALAGVLLVAVAVWRGVVRARNPREGDDPDVVWFGQLGDGAGEDTSLNRRIAAGDASRRRIARIGERWLP